VAFELGIFLGLGGILVCSFLGGMRAVTWTQVAQYIILIMAYLIPVVWLSVKQTSIPVPQAIYGYQLEKVTAKEKELIDDPKEKEVIAAFKAKADEFGDKLKDVKTALEADKATAAKKVEDLKASNAPAADITAAEKALASLPKDEAAAKDAWTKAKAANEARAKPLGGMPRHATQYGGYSSIAAHSYALLHHAISQRSPRLSYLVVVLHLLVVFHCASACCFSEI
jgi:cation/acetate symporter